MLIYSTPAFNSNVPMIAPKKLATLNTDAERVLESNGASFALNIILLLSNGTEPKFAKPNIKQVTIAVKANPRESVNNINLIIYNIYNKDKFLVILFLYA